MNLPITDFLAARYDEDEAAARAATPGRWAANALGGVEAVVDGSVLYDVTSRDGADVDEHGEEAEDHPQSTRDAEHIARHEPARVLADIAARRSIVEALVHVWDPDSRDWTTGDPSADPEYVGGVDAALDYAARALALPYSDHPDYDEEWRP